jgi:3D (Asp-Asp-Asp) domain-containing protein
MLMTLPATRAAKMADPGKGKIVTYTDLSGKVHKLRVTTECYNQAEIEAAAVGVDKDGVEHFAYRVGPGVWKELPQGCAGMGNKLNALVPLDHVAAEQRKFPYGSMIFVPMAVGLKLGDAAPSDGYFWVSDVGSAIKGNHFDLFVGNESVYKDFTGRDAKPTYATTIFRLPTPPKGMDPRTDEGLAAILRRGGYLKDEANPAEKYQVLDALVLFQQANPHIPVAEYGNPRAATTLWFLIQAALSPDAAK